MEFSVTDPLSPDVYDRSNTSLVPMATELPALSPILRLEHRRGSHYCREQLGIDGALCPYSIRASSLDDTPLTLKKIITTSQRHRMELSFYTAAAASMRHESPPPPPSRAQRAASLVAATVMTPRRAASVMALSTMQDLPSTSRGGGASPFDIHRDRQQHAIAAALADENTTARTGRTSRSFQQQSRLPSLVRRSSGANSVRTSLVASPGMRESLSSPDQSPLLLLMMAQASPSSSPTAKKNARNGHCATPYFHASSGDHHAALSRAIETSCNKVDEAQGGHEQERATNAVDYKTVIAALMRNIRPLWPVGAKKWVNEHTMKPTYRIHLRCLWRYAIGRVLSGIIRARQAVVKEAKRQLGELAKQRAAILEKERGRRLAQKAETFFHELLSRRSSKVKSAPLTEDVYKSLRAQFHEIAGDTMELALSIFTGSARVDPALLRKFDRDHSGRLDFFEVLKSTFPAMLAKDLQALMRKWDATEVVVQPEKAAALLSDESKAMIASVFRLCDAEGKGFLTRGDMAQHFVPPEWDPKDPLWFEQFFPAPHSLVSFEEFVEMMRFCFPPFRASLKFEFKRGPPIEPWRVPPEVEEAQDHSGAV